MSDHESNHEFDEELFALAAGSDNGYEAAGRESELEAEIAALKSKLNDSELEKTAVKNTCYRIMAKNGTLMDERDEAVKTAVQAEETLQAREKELAATKKQNVELAIGNLDAFRREPTLEHDTGPSAPAPTTDVYGPMIGFLQKKVGEKSAAESVIRAEKTFEMFRKLGVEHEEERALALLDLLEEKQKENASVKPKLLERASAEVERPGPKRKRATEDDAEKHRNSVRKHRKTMPTRIISCESCREIGQQCDNGWPCHACKRDGKRCYRLWCRYKAAGKCLDESCTRVHDNDAVLGAVNSKTAIKLRDEAAVPTM